MKDKSLTVTPQRIGEILIIGSSPNAADRFIRTICPDVVVQSPELVAGKVEINSELLLYCYGVCETSGTGLQNWDVVASKIMGYVLLVDWHSAPALQNFCNLVNEAALHFTVPYLVAAEVGALGLPYPVLLQQSVLKLDPTARLVFYQGDDKEQIRRVILALFDLLLEQAQSE
jgi:hypothetical protein